MYVVKSGVDKKPRASSLTAAQRARIEANRKRAALLRAGAKAPPTHAEKEKATTESQALALQAREAAHRAATRTIMPRLDHTYEVKLGWTEHNERAELYSMDKGEYKPRIDKMTWQAFESFCKRRYGLRKSTAIIHNKTHKVPVVDFRSDRTVMPLDCKLTVSRKMTVNGATTWCGKLHTTEGQLAYLRQYSGYYLIGQKSPNRRALAVKRINVEDMVRLIESQPEYKKYRVGETGFTKVP